MARLFFSLLPRKDSLLDKIGQFNNGLWFVSKNSTDIHIVKGAHRTVKRVLNRGVIRKDGIYLGIKGVTILRQYLNGYFKRTITMTN